MAAVVTMWLGGTAAIATTLAAYWWLLDDDEYNDDNTRGSKRKSRRGEDITEKIAFINQFFILFLGVSPFSSFPFIIISFLTFYLLHPSHHSKKKKNMVLGMLILCIMLTGNKVWRTPWYLYLDFTCFLICLSKLRNYLHDMKEYL